MKKLLLKQLVLVFTFFGAINFGTSTSAAAQMMFQSQLVDIKLSGTSTLHDWEMKAAKGNSEAAFAVDANGKLTSLTKLSFTLPATSLKSEHTMMDKNTYKALNTEANPNISFIGTSSVITPLGANEYRINLVGKLTIAGTTKEIDLVATVKYNPADKSLAVTGVKKMKMTDYNVKPPTVMMGTIKTGNDITITYNVKFTK
jgi:polyisoprenoid-binding protein YceI